MNREFKDRLASGLGSSFEWYDFALYGFFAPLLAKLYFPAHHYMVSLISAFGVFAIGFAARPVGSIIFGYIGDKYGRTVSLKLTPLLMTLSTCLLPLIPTYAQIGITATLLIVAVRIIQGICIGGEFANNIIYLCETAPAEKHYFYGSIASCTGSFGLLLASSMSFLTFFLLPETFVELWGWRIAFFIGLLIGIIAYMLRKNMLETPIYTTLIQEQRISLTPTVEAFKHEGRQCLIAIGVTYLHATAFYFVFMFLPAFLSQILQTKSSTALGDNTISLCLRILLIPIIGHLADKLGGLKMMLISSFCFLILSYPLFLAMNQNIPWLTTSSFYLFALMTTLNAGTVPGLLVKLLKPNTRCTTLSFSFNICFGIFGGVMPLVSFLLIKQTNFTLSPVFYLMFTALITLLTTIYLQRKNISL